MGYIVGIFMMIFIFAVMKFSLEKGSDKIKYTCKKCGAEKLLAEMKHYDYEYNYEYRCPNCGAIIIEG